VSFPIDRKWQREFSEDWSGESFVCDIDRTYLATRFSSLKGLAKIPLEFAVDKIAIAGMVPLLKEIRRGPTQQSRHTPLFFVSASPKSLRPVLERKMLMDHLEFDGTTFKDWGRVILSGRIMRLKDHIGFKLSALLDARSALPRGAEEILIGDDLESDALIYTLYADILAGRLEGKGLVTTLTEHGLNQNDAEEIAEAALRIGPTAGVKAALIRLEKKTPEHFANALPQLLTCRDSLQLALCLWAGGSISLHGVARVARAMPKTHIPETLADATTRDLLNPTQSAAAQKALL
jgi:hypothetical protein